MLDLSKAFDSLPHGLLIAKLRAYGLNEDFLRLMESYLTEQYQRVTRGHSRMHTSASGPAVISCWERTNYLFCNVSQQQV